VKIGGIMKKYLNTKAGYFFYVCKNNE